MADKIRVLYVDDEPDLLELSRMFLERSGDFSVATIDSGPAALELLGREQFDAIISDYHMPGMDGIQFLIEVRKRFGQVPFILFTGRGREEIVIKAINSGADLYLQKGGETGAQFAELAQKTRIVVERHATIAALKESEEKNRRIVETSHEGIWAMDKDFVTTYVNERMATMLGCTVDEMLGKPVLSFIPEEALADQQGKFMQRFEGKPGSYERQFKVKDGRTRTFNVSATPLIGDDSSVQGSFAMLTDITDRKDAELALQKAHDNLEVQVQERTADLYSANMKLQKEIAYSNLIAESLKEYAKMTSTLNEVIITANKAETLPDLFRDSLDRALELLDFEAGGIYLVNPEERIAEVHYSKNLPDNFIEKTRTISIDAPPYDTLFAKGQPVVTEHFEEFSPELAEKTQIRSLASIPLVSKNRVIGAINLANTKRETLSVDEIQVLTAIGRELGTTIARMIAEEELKTVSVNLQTLFSSINEMVFVLDMEGRIISVNDSVIKHLQYTNEELTGMNVLLLHVPERRDEALRNVQGMIAGTIESCPVPLLSKDGTRTEAETKVTRGWWNGQEVLIGVTRDITERKRMEEALKESEIQYRTMFDNSGDAILIHDMNGRILDVNPVLCDRLGYSREEMLQMTPMDFDSPEYAALVPERIHQVMMKEHHIFETCNVRKDGARIPTEINVQLIDYHGQQVIMSIGRDITERKQAAEALRKSEEKYRQLIENSHDIIYTLTAGGVFIFVSPAWTTLLGHTVTQVTGQSFQKFVHPDDIPGCMVWLQKVIGTGQRQEDIEYRVQHTNGTWYWHTSSAVPFKNEAEKIVGFYGIARDITERKRVEDSLHQLSDRLLLATRAGGVGTWDYDVVHNVLAWDDQMFALYGITMAQFGGAYDAWQARLHPEDRKRGDAEIRMALSGDREFDTEFRVLWPDGSTRTIRALALVQRDAEGTPLRMIGTNWDITSQKDTEAEIERQASLITSLLDSIPDIIFFKDLEGVYLGCNPPFARFVGKSRKEIIGRTDYDLFDKEIADYFVEHDRRMLELGEPRQNEEWITYPDGRKILIDTLKTPYRGPDGTLIGVLGISRDITGRNVAEEKLRHLSDRLSLATQAGGVGTWDYDVVNNILTWDDQMFALYGITRDQFSGAHSAWQAGIHPEDRHRQDSEVRMALSGEKEFDTEFRVLWPDGSTRTIRALALVQRDAKGIPLRVIGTNWDITAEKNAEEVLRENDEKIRLLLNSAAEGIYGLDMDGNCTFCNNSCLRLLGYQDADELLGRNMHWQIHAKYPDGTHFPVEECRIFKAFNNGEGAHVDDEVLWRNDGTSFPAEYWSYPQRHDGEVVGAVVTFLDITDRKEREKEMTYHEQELMRFSSSLAAVNKKLALLSHITRHDINNQLEVLLGYLSLLKYRKLDPTLDEYFQKITTAAERIAVMIRFTREYGSIGVNAPAWQDCASLVDTAVKQAPLGQVLVSNEIPGSVEVFADPLIVKVFYNLMDNAFRYGGKITTIRFSVQESDDGTGIIVCEDDGIGVPAEEKDKIFLREFGQNTGLGLSLSREILDITGITIRETGEPGQGARFEMTVPEGMWRFQVDKEPE